MPHLVSIVRCTTHVAHKALENCLESDSHIQEVLQQMVTAYSSNGSRGGQEEEGGGGLARALTNSVRLQHMLKEEFVSRTDKMFSMRYAKQRFGSIADICGHLIVHVKPLINLLLKIDTAWSRQLLRESFQPPQLLLLALTAEFAGATMRFVRTFDNAKNGISRIARVARAVEGLEAEFQRLFAFRDKENRAREPMVLSSSYHSGFVQTLAREYDFSTSETIIHKGRLLFFKPSADGATLRKWVCKELGSIQNTARLYLQSIKADSSTGLAASLSVFDVQTQHAEITDGIDESALLLVSYGCLRVAFLVCTWLMA